MLNSSSEEDEKKKPPFSGLELGADPAKCPGEGFKWKGKGTPETGKGNWVRGQADTKETLHPDFDHPPPIKPHWDYEGPAYEKGLRFYLDGTWDIKN